jgi:hypothetical protein
MLVALFSNECIVKDPALKTFSLYRIIAGHYTGHVHIWNYDTQASYGGLSQRLLHINFLLTAKILGKNYDW